MPRVALDSVFHTDPAGDIARNAALINGGEMPSHLHRCTPADLVAEFSVRRARGFSRVVSRGACERSGWSASSRGAGATQGTVRPSSESTCCGRASSPVLRHVF